ncbi:MAG TPA: 30S ribosomal protein S9 [Candidatus Saccharimonadales bacterium]|nr:30S ribosomal protein S9 [Candidatus Saccharimonadales bacterium]
MAQAPASTKKTAKAPALKATSTTPKRVKAIANKPFSQGTGRRKSAVARVLLRKGNGQILVNGRSFEEYFTVPASKDACQASFLVVPATSGMTADVKITGGGYTSQAIAAQLGIARALLAFDETLKPELKKHGFLTVDSRVKERKKYGQKGARAKFQFTKR